MKKLLLALFMLTMVPAMTFASICTFEGEGFETLSENTHWGGTDSGKGSFSFENLTFFHLSEQNIWRGFLYSAERDITTPGYLNQYSAITKLGVNDSSNYCVSYIPSDYADLDGDGDIKECIPSTITLAKADSFSGVYITNTTFAYLSMKEGDGFAKKFGGDSGNDEDWFKLTIKGYDEDNKETGTIDFYLADFRFADKSKDYILDEWKWVDLSSLGLVKKLEFTLSSTDNNPTFGMNTPAYFAMDNLTPTDDDDSDISCFIDTINGDNNTKLWFFAISGLVVCFSLVLRKKKC